MSSLLFGEVGATGAISAGAGADAEQVPGLAAARRQRGKEEELIVGDLW